MNVKMINKFGNVIVKANTSSQVEELHRKGFKIFQEEVSLEKQVPVEAEEVSLEKMKVSELEEYANENGIDISECTNKAEKLQKIKSAKLENSEE